MGLRELFKTKPATKQAELFAELERLGFFDHTASAALPQARSEALQYGWPYASEQNGRFFFADAENLGEGGIVDFLKELRPFLEREGVNFEQLSEIPEPDYVVTVNGRQYTIYTADELQRGGHTGLIWGLGTSRGFKLVNDLLQRADSAERLYAINGGNDQSAFFLTEPMYRAIVADPGTTIDAVPYTPTDEHQWFGMPHTDS